MGGSRALAQGWPLIAGAPPTTLGPLTISPATATIGTAYTGTISGATPGSTITLDSLTVTGTGSTRTVTGTPQGSAGVWPIVETLSGAIGSPRTTQNALLVAAASGVTPVIQNVRATINSVTDSAGDATLQTAIQQSATNKKHARIPLAVNQTRTIVIDATFGASGGLIYMTADRQDLVVYATSSGLGATATLERSTNGGTSYSAVSLAQGGNLDQARSFTVPGGNCLLRLVGTNAAIAAANLAIALYERPASGKMDGWLIHGASFEDFGHNPLRFTDALQTAYPGCDPFVHTQGMSGQTTAQVSARAVVDYPNFPLCNVAYFNQGGNSLNPRPITPVNNDFANLKADITAAINAAKSAGMKPLVTNISYRDLPDPYVADNTMPQNGSDPVNKGVLYPLFSSLVPELMISDLGITRVDQYGFALPKRNDSAFLVQGDQHFRDGYNGLRALEASNMVAQVYGQPFPATAYESAVAAFESAKTVATKNPAYDLVTSLPDTAAKTAYQNRLAAFLVPQPVNSAVPTITGTAAVGEVLTLSRGTWSNSPLNYPYTLTRSDGTTAASGIFATNGQNATITYTQGGSDQGKTLTLNVQAINGNGTLTAAVSSVATGTIAAPTGQSNGGSLAANTFPFTGSADAVTGPNLIADTDTVDTAAWTRSGLATPVTGQADCRNGFTAVKLSPANDGGNNLRRFSKTISGFTQNALNQYSIEVRGVGDPTKGGRYLYVNLGAQGQITFDLTNGTFTTPQSGVTAYATDLGNGWWRFSVRATFTTTAKLGYYQINNSNTAADTTYPGDGTSGQVVAKTYAAKV
jgi:hypothetical protein